MSSHRRNHYVAKFHLNKFSDNSGMIWRYNRETDEYDLQHPSNVAVLSNYYRFLGKDNKYHKDIEHMFNDLETKAAPIIDRIERKLPLDQDDKNVLAVYFSYQRLRVPDFEKLIQEFEENTRITLLKQMVPSAEAAKDIISKYENHIGKKTNIDPRYLYDAVHKNKHVKFSVDVPKEYYLHAMLMIGLDQAQYFMQMDWTCLFAPNRSSFIISDNPFCILPPEKIHPFYGVGIITKGAKKIIPLSSKVLLVMGDKGDKVIGHACSREICKKINYSIALRSDKYIFSHSNELLRSIVEKTKLHTVKKGKRVKMG